MVMQAHLELPREIQLHAVYMYDIHLKYSEPIIGCS